jgi:hypothetical protein
MVNARPNKKIARTGDDGSDKDDHQTRQRNHEAPLLNTLSYGQPIAIAAELLSSIR